MDIIAARPYLIWDGLDEGQLSPATGQGVMLHSLQMGNNIGTQFLIENTALVSL